MMERLRAEILSRLSSCRNRDLLKQLQPGSALALSALLTILLCICAKVSVERLIKRYLSSSSNAVLLSFLLRKRIVFFRQLLSVPPLILFFYYKDCWRTALHRNKKEYKRETDSTSKRGLAALHITQLLNSWKTPWSEFIFASLSTPRFYQYFQPYPIIFDVHSYFLYIRMHFITMLTLKFAKFLLIF